MKVQNEWNWLNAAAGAAALAATLAVSTPAPARTAFDGAWSVLIVTDAGACERAYRYGVQIVNGRVLADGGAAASISGRVTPRGQVSVQVRQGDQHAVGSGQLTQMSGSGRWRGSSPGQACAGHWTAQRRGY